jgi:5'(3')-deoxyribonucleotidase
MNKNEDVSRGSLKTEKEIIYIDMDGVLCDYSSFFDKKVSEGMNKFQVYKIPGAFDDLQPIKGAINAFNVLDKYFEVYILSTPMWSNPDSWRDKRIWVEKYLGKIAKKKLILSHNKGLMKGKYLIDDREANGVLDFEGEHIKFGENKFKEWISVIEYLFKKENISFQNQMF